MNRAPASMPVRACSSDSTVPAPTCTCPSPESVRMTSAAPGTVKVTSTNRTPASPTARAVASASSAVLERITATRRWACMAVINSVLVMKRSS